MYVLFIFNKETTMIRRITRPGICEGGTTLAPAQWRSIEPGDEMWFLITHGAEGTRLGSVNWLLVKDSLVLRFGLGDTPRRNSQFVFGWPFPQTKVEFDSPAIQDKLDDLLWTVQVLLSTVTCLKTELDTDPPALGSDWHISGRRIAILRFLETQSP